MNSGEPEASTKFDLENTLEVLEELAQEDARTRAQCSAIESAAKALHFLRRTGRLDEFRDYLREFNTAEERAIRVVQSFAGMSEAMEWLRAQQDPPYGATVDVAGIPHLVARQRTDKWFLVPAPTLPPHAPEDEP